MQYLINFFLCVLIFSASQAQTKDSREKAAVMVLGTFHYSYPNLDLVKTEKKDQVDVMSEKRQQEIVKLVNNLKKFKPTVVAIEYKTWKQALIDSQYHEFLKGRFELPRDEAYQVGFRLAKMMNLEKVHCIDTWGNIDYFYQTKDQKNFEVNPERKKLIAAYDQFEDSLLKAGAFNSKYDEGKPAPVYESVTEMYKKINNPEKLLWDHQGYFKERFRFEYEPYDYTGSDWIALSWYSRNLRIFRNIQRITTKPTDRIFIIYGSGHAYLLNQFIRESPDHRLVSPLEYLK